ncbi:Major cardiolipin synthase ClsA [Roseibium album]|nr:Major cardiolipin synthase ClsA [Roseibium album]
MSQCLTNSSGTFRRFSVALVFVIGFTLASCTHVPFNFPKTASYASTLPKRSTTFIEAEELIRGHGGKSAFIPLVEGNDALGARLKLIEAAEHSIDAQYFLIKPDSAGSLFSLALINAAERGVRVRLLVDDVFTTANDEQLAYLSSYDNIEVRIFNPLSRNSTKAMNFVLDFGRVNRRMHNKSLTIDNAMSIVGGRNIAEEYFQINTNAEFADFDLFCAGPVARKITAAFDIFWNDPLAVPIEAFVSMPTEIKRQDTRARIEEKTRQATLGVYQRAINSRYLRDISAGKVQLDYANVQVVTDDPDKLRTPVRDGERLVADAIRREMEHATSEVTIITPYFVPRKEGVKFYKTLSARGVRVRVITNSLASTNHAYVHGGYAPYRKELLKAGVELYEVRADAPEVLGEVLSGSDIKLTMHSKAALFDRKRMFVGSLNFDPRSIEINTELGLIIADRRMVSKIAGSLEKGLRDYTYRVELGEDGKLTWTYSGAGLSEVLVSEPGAGIVSKTVSWITRVLPVEGQL